MSTLHLTSHILPNDKNSLSLFHVHGRCYVTFMTVIVSLDFNHNEQPVITYEVKPLLIPFHFVERWATFMKKVFQNI